jgi:hypothetical protein
MSISQNFPEEGPTLNLNFAGSRTLDPRITFTRTSSATFMGRDGLVKIAPANSARFDHLYNSTTGEVESLGLLIEESRSNLLTYSEDFNITWQTPGSSIIETSTIFPNGDISGPNLVENDNNTFHNVQYPNLSVISGVTYTVSIFAKFSGRNVLQIAFGSASFGLDAFANFNLNTGTIGTVGTNATAKMEMFPNGWYRCIITSTATNTDTSFLFFLLQRFSTDPRFSAYLGNGSDGILIWGAQVEAGAFPTSYIPTTTSTVTRTADNASITGSNFSDFYNPSEGTIYCSANNNPGVTTTTSRFFYAFERSDGTSADFIRKWIWAGNTGLLFNSIYTSNSGPVAAEFNTTLETTNKRTAIAYKQNDFARSYNGSTPSTDNIGNLPVGIDRVRIGTNLSGHIAQLTYYPQRLQNSQLITLTK